MKKSEKQITSMNLSIVDRAVPYKNGTKNVTYVYHVITSPSELLNERSELVSKCRHENKL